MPTGPDQQPMPGQPPQSPTQPRRVADVQERIDLLHETTLQTAKKEGHIPRGRIDSPSEEELNNLTEVIGFAQLPEIMARQALRRAASKPPSTPQENH